MPLSRIAGLSVAGHQPNFFPWFGYFEKMFCADIFVFSDDVRFPKQSYVNRVAIPIGDGTQEFQWVLPVLKGNDEAIAAKRYVRDEKCLRKLLRTVDVNLGGLPYFADVRSIMEQFKEAYSRFETISELNMHMNRSIAGLLGIKTPTLTGTELGLGAYRSNERLIARCQVLNCDTYISGQGASDYTEPEEFVQAGLKLVLLDYRLGRRLLGEDLKFSILVAIGQHGLQALADAFAKEKDGTIEGAA